ncbi:MAG: serpin family protein, partial [Methanoregulaceae archaeon]|nr:serpin family protein [Methanoregulaceae archaeon]
KGDNLTAVEDSLDANNLSLLRKSLQPRLVFIYFPRFKMEPQYQMDSVLKNMGMPTAFTNKSDFSGMDGTRNLSISTIIHKAYVDVDEKGTRAAAATVVHMNKEQSGAAEYPEPVIFRADHPFLFIIQDKESGNIIFMGRVMNPNA